MTDPSAADTAAGTPQCVSGLLADSLVPGWTGVPRTRHFIGGQWTSGRSGSWLPTEDPSNAGVLAEIDAGAAADVDRAVVAARQAFDAGSWARATPAVRASLLAELARRIEEDAERIALLETLENGMPISLARDFGVAGAVNTLRYHIGWATKLTGETVAPSAPGDWHVFTTREPIGVVAVIVPWNMPFAMTVGKLAPALAAGCTVVIKPSELTTLSTLRLAELIDECGFPAGVVNVVTGTGSEVGAALANHPDVDKISFTGSVRTGRDLVRAAAGTMKRLTLELGGNAPVFVFADSDLDAAIQGTAMGIFNNAGQVCTAGSRLYMERSVYDRVLDGVVRAADELTVGPGLDPTTQMGPLISGEHRERVHGFVIDALERGASLAAGGGILAGPGYFMQPTVLTDVHPQMPVVEHEVFGPVLTVQAFDDVDGPADAVNGTGGALSGDMDVVDRDERIVRWANSTDYGLSASLWTADVRRALRLGRRIRAGTIKVNSPFGVDPSVPFGGFGLSGWGRENGRIGIEAYTEVKSTFMGL